MGPQELSGQPILLGRSELVHAVWIDASVIFDFLNGDLRRLKRFDQKRDDWGFIHALCVPCEVV